jgi:signal transduction histidine kinase
MIAIRPEGVLLKEFHVAISTAAPNDGGPALHRLLPYMADLELEVDRLRYQARFLELEVAETVSRIRRLCAGDGKKAGSSALAEVDSAVAHLAEVITDLRESSGYHPSHDQVVSIAVRPLVNRVFRRQQRMQSAPQAIMRLDLACESVDWFPARLHHVLDNLISNALKYRDPAQAEPWVAVSLRETSDGYEMKVADNGVGLATADRSTILELFYRAAPARAAGLGVGLAVVRMLVEQSGGSLTLDSGAGQGATFVAVLPRYDLTDFLT